MWLVDAVVLCAAKSSDTDADKPVGRADTCDTSALWSWHWQLVYGKGSICQQCALFVSQYVDSLMSVDSQEMWVDFACVFAYIDYTVVLMWSGIAALLSVDICRLKFWPFLSLFLTA